MKKLLLIFLLLPLHSIFYAQSVMLTAEETGRMFHVVQKSPVLERNLNQFFNYTGDTVYFKYFVDSELDSIIDYDSIVQKIKLEPSLLKIDHYGLANASHGLLSELASKMALYQLYRELKDRKNPKEEGISDQAYQFFQDTLILKLPNELVRKKNGVEEPSNKVIDLIDPNYFFNQRANTLTSFQSITQPQQKDVILAINYATRSYLQYKGKEYFSKICSSIPEFTTYLIACGDGSNSYGLLDEREKIYKQKNELGDPVGLGLFTYEPKFRSAGGNRQELTPEQSVMHEFNTLSNERTNLHFSLWGFNRDQQTTVAVYRGDQMYLLYANKITKELSPDTTFGKGTTLQSIVKQLEDFALPKVDEEINGKDGLREKIENKDTSYNDVLMEIVETEILLTNLRYNGLKNKKKTKKAQDHLAYLYSRKATIEKQQKELMEHLRDAEERLARLTERLFELKSYLDYREIKYSNFGYIYTFEDGVTFNANTQNFSVPDSIDTDDLKVRLITFGKDALAMQMDEIQLLVSVSKGEPEDFETHDYAITLEDVFQPDNFSIKNIELSDKQHFEISKLLNLVLTNDFEINYKLTGNGAGKFDEGKITKWDTIEEEFYPGETDEERKESRESDAYKSLRVSFLKLSRESESLSLEISSFTDPVKSNLTYKVSGVRELKKQFDSISDNQLLSAFRSFHIAEQMTRLMMISCHGDFNDKNETKIMNSLKNSLKKSKVQMGELYLRYSDYEKIAHPNTNYLDSVEEELENKDKEILLKLGYPEEE